MEIKDIGYYHPNLFGSKNYFTEFLKAHALQKLTESNKGDVAYRKGVYITSVTKSDDATIKFNLLRCSTNLQGPTENLTDVDNEIIQIAQLQAKNHYPNSAPLNHVLAQVYYNYLINNRNRRAAISSHSDKTEDMAENGLIVFCTFYDPDILQSNEYKEVDGDIRFKNTSALTSLKFVSKTTKEVTHVTLQPNSALFIDLNTNRTHTHEIVPPKLASCDIPTRLGYVIRCSNVSAVYKNEKTYLLNPETKEYTELLPVTDEKIKMLKQLYAQENRDLETPNYPFIDFSLNQGDYLEPALNPTGLVCKELDPK
jgi:hypothetical protein